MTTTEVLHEWKRGDRCVSGSFRGFTLTFVEWAKVFVPETITTLPCFADDPFGCAEAICIGHEIEANYGETIEDPAHERAIVVMVGDDERHEIEVADLVPLPEDEHVCSCGQRGCHAYG